MRAMRNLVVVFFTVFSLALIPVLVTPQTGLADTPKNDGILPDKGVDDDSRMVPANLPFGTRVRAVVNYPAGSNCILVGYEGTVICYDSNDPSLPYLVDWDQPCGFEQCQGCGICATHGWWVGFADIELADVSTADILSGCLDINGTPVSGTVIMVQPGTSPVRDGLDANGCFEFEVNTARPFRMLITGQ